MMPMLSMHMPMRQFFVACGAHIADCALEMQRLTGKRVIAIHHDFAFGDIGDGVNNRVAGFLAAAFKLHADFHGSRKFIARLDVDELRIVIAESVVGHQLYAARFANVLAFKCFLDGREHIAISAMQIFHWLFCLFDELAVSAIQLILQRYNRILGYLHFLMPLTRLSTSAACPREVTP